MTLKRARRSAQAMAKSSAATQPRLLTHVQVGDEQHESRRDAEIDEIGERIELRPEARGALQRARDAAVEAVKDGGADDGDHRPFDRPFHREPYRRQAETQSQQRYDVREEEPHRHRPKAPPAPRFARARRVREESTASPMRQLR